MANREKYGRSRRGAKDVGARELRVREQRRETRARDARAAAARVEAGTLEAGSTGEAAAGAPSDAAWPAEAWLVTEITSGRCALVLGARELAAAVPARLAREYGGALAIGDRVRLDPAGTTVVEILPRRAHLARRRADRTRQSGSGEREHVLAANVDLAVIVASLRDPPFHPRLIDRFLIMAQHGGIRPLICLNKCELGEPPPELGIYAGLGVPVVAVSAATGSGLAALRASLQGHTAVLVGHSGVGKSSLINALLGHAATLVGAVGGKSSRGRHTTTAAKAHRLDEATYLFDTPGIRSWGLWSIAPAELQGYFAEFAAYREACRYRDCTHRGEPDCAVRAAVEAGQISAARYESYARLYEEEGPADGGRGGA